MSQQRFNPDKAEEVMEQMRSFPIPPWLRRRVQKAVAHAVRQTKERNKKRELPQDFMQRRFTL